MQALPIAVTADGGPAVEMFGLGADALLCLARGRQGSGKVLGLVPALAGTARLLAIAGLGAWLVRRPGGATAQALFVRIAAAMAAYGLAAALSVKLTRWG